MQLFLRPENIYKLFTAFTLRLPFYYFRPSHVIDFHNYKLTCECASIPSPLLVFDAPLDPPLEAELSLDNMETLSEKAESLSGLSVRPTARDKKIN